MARKPESIDDCPVCSGAHDPAIHAATQRVHRRLSDELGALLEFHEGEPAR